MTRLKKLLDARSVSPQTAATWANLSLGSIYDAYNGTDDGDEMMICWGLPNVFSLASKLDIPASTFFVEQPVSELHPATLHSEILRHLQSPTLRKEFEKQCDWELHAISKYEEWLQHVSGWCPEVLKNICDCLNLNWLSYLNGLFLEWIRVSAGNRPTPSTPSPPAPPHPSV